MSHLVLVGAGHVHLGLIARIPTLCRMGHQVSVISDSPCYCYSGMAPGVLGGRYEETDITLDIEDIVSGFGVKFIPHEVVRIDPVNRLLVLRGDERIHYDVVSFNIGSSIATEGLNLDPDLCILAKPIIYFAEIRRRVEYLLQEKTVPQIIVAGGGPAGLEIAANIADLAEKKGAKKRSVS